VIIMVGNKIQLQASGWVATIVTLIFLSFLLAVVLLVGYALLSVFGLIQ